MDALTTTALAIACALLILYLVKGPRSAAAPFPGPRPLPFLGNPDQVLVKEPWVQLGKLRQRYGPITYLRLLGAPLLVLNNAATARELLEAKSALYSNRPLPKMVELSGFDKGIVMEHDPARLRHGRKLLHQSLGAKQALHRLDVHDYHVHVLLRNLLLHPAEFISHIRHLAAGVNVELSHGYRVTERDDAFVHKADQFGENFADATLLQYVVDWVPWLSNLPSWLPGMGFKTTARRYRDQYFSLAQEGHQLVKDQIAKGTARPSLTYSALAECEPGQNPDDIIMFTATQVYTGGGDTTSSVLTSFILYMVLYPETQKRAQAELEAVLGPGRLPGASDRESLPYVEAILMECLRLRPPINTVYRQAAQDDIHDGHFIEKGTILLVNFWGMLHDETIYPEPDVFKPDRWLGKPRDPNTHVQDVVFGFGRRICPGRMLGEETLFLAMSRILALFDIAPARDENGRSIIPAEEMTIGGITCPVPFKCSITPRLSRTREVIQAYFDHATS